MLFVDLLGWWYSRGWEWIAKYFFVAQTTKLARFFSIGDLAKTLFSPFRQDAVDTRHAPMGVKLQAFGGNIISRIFGLIIRTTLIMLGLILIAGNSLVATATVLFWPLLPLLPVVSVVLLIVKVGSS